MAGIKIIYKINAVMLTPSEDRFPMGVNGGSVATISGAGEMSSGCRDVSGVVVYSSLTGRTCVQPRVPTRVLVAMRPARAACCSAHREGVVRCRLRRERTSGFELVLTQQSLWKAAQTRLPLMTQEQFWHRPVRLHLQHHSHHELCNSGCTS